MQRQQRFGLACLLLLILSAASSAQPTMQMNQVYVGAIEQPQLNAAVRYNGTLLTGTGLDPITLEEIDTYTITGYADTGGGTVLLGPSTVADFGIPMQTGAVFTDVGVGGASTFGISESVTFQVTHYDSDLLPLLDNPGTIDDVYKQVFSPIRNAVGPDTALPDSTDPLDGIIASLSEFVVFGMPLLKNKTMVMDSRVLNTAADVFGDGSPGAFGDILDFEDLDNLPELKNYLYDSPNAPSPRAPEYGPGIPSNYDVKIKTTYADFSGYTQTTGGTPPALTYNPFIGSSPLDPSPVDPLPGIITDHGPSSSTEGNWLFDTGGAATIMSSAIAATHGVTYSTATGHEYGSDDPQLVGVSLAEQFQLTLSGVGETVTVAGFYLQEMRVPVYTPDDTLIYLVYNDVPILVADIKVEEPDAPGTFVTLDGVFGMNLLFPSVLLDDSFLTGDIFGLLALLEAPMITSNFDFVTFDEPTGEVRLNFNPVTISDLILPGDANNDGVVDEADFLAIEANFGAIGHDNDWLIGDANGDGRVDGDDWVWVEQHFGATLPGGGIPEPATALLLVSAIAIGVGRAGRARR